MASKNNKSSTDEINSDFSHGLNDDVGKRDVDKKLDADTLNREKSAINNLDTTLDTRVNTIIDTALDTTASNAAKNVANSHARFDTLSRYIEVLLHASETPLTDKQLRQHLSLSKQELEAALLVLQQRLSTGVLQLYHSNMGYRLQIANRYSSLVQQAFPQRPTHLSQALLETLSVVAYKQPVTRSDIEQIRGVTVSSNILRQLFDKGWIMEKGYKDTLGRPALLHTTPEFLEAFGLASLDDLPELPDLDSLKDNS